MFSDSRSEFAYKLFSEHPSVLNNENYIAIFKINNANSFVDITTLELIDEIAQLNVSNVTGLQEQHFGKLYWQIYQQKFGFTQLDVENGTLSVSIIDKDGAVRSFFKEKIPFINDYKAALSALNAGRESGVGLVGELDAELKIISELV
jgi:hypothetical protein